MQDDARELIHDFGKDSLVVLDLEFGVETALEQDLDPSFVDRVLNLLKDRLVGKKIALVMPWDPVEGTKFAATPADVSVVKDPADHVRDVAARNFLLTSAIG